jgi:hypothetical protein
VEGDDHRAIVYRARDDIGHDAAVHHVDDVWLRPLDEPPYTACELEVCPTAQRRAIGEHDVDCHADIAKTTDLIRDEGAAGRTRLRRVHVRDGEDAHRAYARASRSTGARASRTRATVGETLNRKRRSESLR